MNIQQNAIRTADDFLRWNEGREGRREFVRGRVVEMMTGGTRRHAELTLQLAFLLKTRLRETEFLVTVADFAVRTPFGVRYPDVMVTRREGNPSDLATDCPVLVAEILSPSSLAIDFSEKAGEYTAILSLAHYLVLSQDEPRVWLWRRGDGGDFGKPEMFVGGEETVPLPGLGVEMTLGDVYRRLG